MDEKDASFCRESCYNSPVGTPMVGNIGPDTKSRGVHDDIYCNILILNDNSTKVCLLGFDMIGLEYTTCTDLRNGIGKITDIPAENIVMWSTHVHSITDTGMCQETENSRGAFFEEMSVKVVAGVAKANEKYEEVVLKIGKTNVADLNFNRHLAKKDGCAGMNFEETEVTENTDTNVPADKELITLSAWDKNDKLFALLINFTLHPVTLAGDKWLFYRNFVNCLDQYILDNYGDQVVTLFANGVGGMSTSLITRILIHREV